MHTVVKVRELPLTRLGARQLVWEVDEGDHYVLTSSLTVHTLPRGSETQVLRCSAYGDITDYTPLPGSLTGSEDHERAIARYVKSLDEDA